MVDWLNISIGTFKLPQMFVFLPEVLPKHQPPGNYNGSVSIEAFHLPVLFFTES